MTEVSISYALSATPEICSSVLCTLRSEFDFLVFSFPVLSQVGFALAVPCRLSCLEHFSSRPSLFLCVFIDVIKGFSISSGRYLHIFRTAALKSLCFHAGVLVSRFVMTEVILGADVWSLLCGCSVVGFCCPLLILGECGGCGFLGRQCF